MGISAGDVNNDGINDIVAPGYFAEGGCKNPSATNCGSAVIYYGPISSGIDATPDTELFGTDQGSKAMTNVGDVDNDGIMDILLGGANKSAPGEIGLASGGLNIYYGIDSVHGESFSSIPNIELFGFNNSDACAEHQSSAVVADIDNDGYNEVILGCKDAEPSGGNGEGSIQVFDPWNLYPSNLTINISVLPETGAYAACTNNYTSALQGAAELDYKSCLNSIIKNNCNTHASQNCTLNVTVWGANGTNKLAFDIEYTGFWWNITNSSANNIIDSVNYWINVTPFESVTHANATYTQTNFTIDHTLPSSITLQNWSNEKNFSMSSKTMNLNWTAVDNLGGILTCDVSMTTSGGALNLGNQLNIPCASGLICNRQINNEVNYPEGTYTWNVTCKDTAGNLNKSATWAFRIDNTPPTRTDSNVTATDPSLRLINRTSSVDIGTNITFRAIFSDTLTGISAVWVRIWQTTRGAGLLLWEGFMSLVNGIWQVSWVANASLPPMHALVNYTIYANDTANNIFSFDSNFTANYPPTQGQPLLASGFYNTTYGNLTCSNTSTNDSDYDAVVNVFDFRLNGASDAVLNMPFEANRNSTQAKDYSTYSNNGTVYGARFTSAGKSGSAYYFDGIDDYIDLGNPTALNANFTAFTLEAWVMVNTTPAGSDEPLIVGKGTRN